MISNPLNYFIGIFKEDKSIAKEILIDDEFDPPLVIDIGGGEKQDLPDQYTNLSGPIQVTVIKKCLKIM